MDQSQFQTQYPQKSTTNTAQISQSQSVQNQSQSQGQKSPVSRFIIQLESKDSSQKLDGVKEIRQLKKNIYASQSFAIQAYREKYMQKDQKQITLYIVSCLDNIDIVKQEIIKLNLIDSSKQWVMKQNTDPIEHNEYEFMNMYKDFLMMNKKYQIRKQEFGQQNNKCQLQITELQKKLSETQNQYSELLKKANTSSQQPPAQNPAPVTAPQSNPQQEKEIQDLKKEVSTLKIKVKTTEQEKINTQNKYTQQISQQTSSIKQLDLQIDMLKKEKSQYQQKYNTINQKLSENQQFLSNKQNLIDENQSLNSQISLFKQQFAEKEERLDILQEERDFYYNKFQKQIQNIKNRQNLSKLSQEMEQENKIDEKQNEQIESYIAELKNKSEKLQEYENEILNLKLHQKNKGRFFLASFMQFVKELILVSFPLLLSIILVQFFLK